MAEQVESVCDCLAGGRRRHPHAGLCYVTLRGRNFAPWLRVLGAVVLVECAINLVYAVTPRYYFSKWLLAALIVAAVIERRWHVPAGMME